MINQINSIANKNVFAPLQSNSAVYAIPKPFTKTQKKDYKKEEEKKTNKFGLNIAIISLIAGFGALAVMKGLPKNTRIKIDEVLKNIEKKANKIIEKHENLSGIRNFYAKTIKGATTALKNMRAIFTLAPLKDVLVLKGIEKIPFLKKAGDKITNSFEKLSIKTSRKHYSKTLVNFDTMFANFAEADKKITNPKTRKQIEELTNNIRNNYTQNFNETARNARLIDMKKAMDKDGPLSERFWQKTWAHFKNFVKSKEAYTTFISEKLVEGAKENLIKDVTSKRGLIDSDIKKLLKIYSEELPVKDYKSVEKSVDKSLKTFDKAINMETDKLFDKVRDFKIGSAPKDTLAILASFGVVGWGLTKAENNEERISSALRYGIPAIGAVLTTVLCTVGLIAGGPSLIIGLFSGLGINKLGVVIDNMRKRYKENKPIVELPTIESPKQILQEIEDNKSS